MFVKDIPLLLNIGLFPEERAQEQTVLCSLELKVNPAEGDQDEIINTVNYYDLTKKVQMAAKQQSFKLLEPLAEIILDVVFTFDYVEFAKVTLVKPEIMLSLGAKDCGIEVERSLA